MNEIPRMKFVVAASPLLGLLMLAGCHTAKNVAVTSFHVMDAPAHFVRRKIDEADQPTKTTSAHSDVTHPGARVTPTPTATPRRSIAQHSATPSPHPSPKVASSKSPTPNASPKPTASSPAFPTAKAVPGKPGYVFSPFDPSGGYVDVSGYASGSKVKDPYSGKIFLVP